MEKSFWGMSMVGVIHILNALQLCWFISFQTEFAETAAYINAGLELGWLKPVVAKEYSLENAAQAHKDIMGGQGGAQGKLILNC